MRVIQTRQESSLAKEFMKDKSTECEGHQGKSPMPGNQEIDDNIKTRNHENSL